jgi:hypothetical protein
MKKIYRGNAEVIAIIRTYKTKTYLIFLTAKINPINL